MTRETKRRWEYIKEVEFNAFNGWLALFAFILWLPVIIAWLTGDASLIYWLVSR